PHCIHVRVALPPISIFVCTLFRFLFLFLFLFFFFFFFFFNDPATTEIYTLSLHDALPISIRGATVEVPTLSGTKRIRVPAGTQQDRKSTRLNSSHVSISYAVFCLKKKKKKNKKKKKIQNKHKK